MDNRGEQIISLYWFFILFIVAAAIVYMVMLFYGKPYDVREAEANLLANKISDCLIYGGVIDTGLFSSDDLSQQCGIDFKIEDTFDWQDDQYYYLVIVYDFKTREEVVIFSSERFVWVDSCNSKLDSNPFCIRKEIYAVDSNDRSYLVDIFASVRKTEKNVR